MVESTSCERCGLPLAPDTSFCPACGAAITRPGALAHEQLADTVGPAPLASTPDGEPAISASPAKERPRSAWPPPGQSADAPPGATLPPPLIWPATSPTNPSGLPLYPSATGGAAWDGPGWADPLSSPGSAVASFGAPLAGWWQRVGAMVLDGIILAIPSWLLLVAFSVSRIRAHANGTTTHPNYGVELGLFVLSAVYFSLFNGLGAGQTPGNRAPGIAVRDAQTGQPIGAWRGLLRWFIRTVLYVAFVIPGLVNDLFPLWDRQHQTLADKAARSVVIRLR